MDRKKPALSAQDILLLRDHNYPQRLCQFFIIFHVLFIFPLRNKYMGQIIHTLQLKQPLEIMRLMPFDPKSVHQIRDQSVIVFTDLITDVFLRSEITCDT